MDGRVYCYGNPDAPVSRSEDGLLPPLLGKQAISAAVLFHRACGKPWASAAICLAIGSPAWAILARELQ